MSTERKRTDDLADAGHDDRDIADFLKSHPDFFERHPGLLAHLRLPHEVGANAVSLIERQVSILREKNRKLDQKLRELIGVARANDVLATKIHKFSMRLVGGGKGPDVLAAIQTTLHQDLGADSVTLILFDDAPGAETDLFEAGFVRRLSRKSSGLELFQSFLNTGRPRCGQVRGAKREFLFGREATDIQSASLIPLGAKAATGFVAIGSRDPARFHPGMSTDFLARLGELIERGLATAG